MYWDSFSLNLEKSGIKTFTTRLNLKIMNLNPNELKVSSTFLRKLLSEIVLVMYECGLIAGNNIGNCTASKSTTTLKYELYEKYI